MEKIIKIKEETKNSYEKYIDFKLNDSVGSLTEKTNWFKDDIEIKMDNYRLKYYCNFEDERGKNNVKVNTFPSEYNKILISLIKKFIKNNPNSLIKRFNLKGEN